MAFKARNTFDFDEVDAVGRKGTKAFVETCGDITCFKDECGFVFFLRKRNFQFFRSNKEKTCRISCKISDTWSQLMESVDLSCNLGCYCPCPPKPCLSNHLGTGCGIGVFDRFEPMFHDEFMTLHEGLWVRIHFLDIGKVVFKRPETMVHFLGVFSHDFSSKSQKPIEVFMDTSRSSIFYGQYSPMFSIDTSPNRVKCVKSEHFFYFNIQKFFYLECCHVAIGSGFSLEKEFHNCCFRNNLVIVRKKEKIPNFCWGFQEKVQKIAVNCKFLMFFLQSIATFWYFFESGMEKINFVFPKRVSIIRGISHNIFRYDELNN